MKYFVVIDTNVLVSALLSSKKDSATVQIMEKVFKKEIIPLYSKEILDEYKNVLHRRKFNFSENVVNYMISAIENFGILKNPCEVEIILTDMKDLPFYRIILDNEESYLITGNLKHFPKNNRIISAREFLNLIDN